MRLAQLEDRAGHRQVVAIEGAEARLVTGAGSVYELAMEAAASGESLADTVRRHGLGKATDLAEAYAAGRLLAPVDHPDPAHCYVTGTA